MFSEVLRTQGARALAIKLWTYFSQNISATAPERLNATGINVASSISSHFGLMTSYGNTDLGQYWLG